MRWSTVSDPSGASLVERVISSRPSPPMNSSRPQPSATATEPTVRRLAASTTTSRPDETVKILRPSVLTMSASSTPTSWTFVPEKSTPSTGAAAPAESAGVASSAMAISASAAGSRIGMGPNQPPRSKPHGPTRAAYSVCKWSSSVSQSSKRTRPAVSTTSSGPRSMTSPWPFASTPLAPALVAVGSAGSAEPEIPGLPLGLSLPHEAARMARLAAAMRILRIVAGPFVAERPAARLVVEGLDVPSLVVVPECASLCAYVAAGSQGRRPRS